MRHLKLLILFLMVSCISVGQQITSKDSIEITNKINDWNKGWKQKDYKLTTQWYSDQAEFTNAFGHNMIGQDSIETFMNHVFKLPFVMAGDSKVTGQKFIPLSEEIVLVVTSIERTGQQTNEGKELGIRKTTHHRIFKMNKEWFIVAHLISDARDTNSSNH